MGYNIIALLSDLGTKDYFVGAMKGAILSVDPDAKIVDISHEVPKQDVRTAAFTLAQAAETFPPGTIFVVVVDPGVGTKRRCILLQTKNGLSFIGPDNGVFTLVAERFGVSKIYHVTNRTLMRPRISPTFHGRDVMAPIAAHLFAGLELSEVGPRLKTLKLLKIPRPELTKEELHGHVLNIDDFGNVITNIGADLVSRFAKLGEALKVKIGDRLLHARLARTFGDVGKSAVLVYVGSAGLLEVARNAGNLAAELNIKPGDEVVIRHR